MSTDGQRTECEDRARILETEFAMRKMENLIKNENDLLDPYSEALCHPPMDSKYSIG